MFQGQIFGFLDSCLDCLLANVLSGKDIHIYLHWWDVTLRLAWFNIYRIAPDPLKHGFCWNPEGVLWYLAPSADSDSAGLVCPAHPTDVWTEIWGMYKQSQHPPTHLRLFLSLFGFDTWRLNLLKDTTAIRIKARSGDFRFNSGTWGEMPQRSCGNYSCLCACSLTMGDSNTLKSFFSAAWCHLSPAGWQISTGSHTCLCHISTMTFLHF